ncbi:MAG: T9SS type A sorting domain-containing protein [Bacteroidota bacterium]
MKTILFLLFAIPGILYSQLTWDRTYSAQGNIAYAIMPNSNGYAVAGNHNITGQFLLFQLDKWGNQLWTGSYGRRYGLFDREFMEDAVRDKAGSFFLGGLSFSIPDTNWEGSSFAYIVKTDSMGRQLWDYQRYTSKEDIPIFSNFMDVEPTTDGGCIGIGYIFADRQNSSPIMATTKTLIVRLDKDGNVVFEKIYDTAPFVNPLYYSICQMHNPSKGFLGASVTDKLQKIHLFKLGQNGDSLWSRTYSKQNVSSSHFYEVGKIRPTSDGNYLLTARGVDAGMIMKIDSSGNPIWVRDDIFYGAWNSFEDQDGNYVLSHGGFFTVLSPDGRTLYTSEPYDFFDDINFIRIRQTVPIPNRQYLQLIDMRDGIRVMKTDCEGNVIDPLPCAFATDIQEIRSANNCFSLVHGPDSWMLRYRGKPIPEPFMVTVYNIQGASVLTESVNSPETSTFISHESLAKGLYVIQVKDEAGQVLFQGKGVK